MTSQRPLLDLASALIRSSTGGIEFSNSTLISSIFFFRLRDGFVGEISLRTTVTEPLPDLRLLFGRPRPGIESVSPGLEPGGTVILRSSESM